MAGRRKPKKKAGMGYILILLIILIIFAAVGVFISKRFAPSKAQADLLSYYNLTAYESMDRPAAGSDELALIMSNQILDIEDTDGFRAVRSDGGIYVDLALIQDHIDTRFYLDRNENVVIFTNAVDSIVAPVDSSVYTSGGAEHDDGYPIARTINGRVYLNMDFVTAHSKATYQVLSDPARVYIRTGAGTADYTTATADIKMRASGSKKAAVVTVVEKSEKLEVLERADDWLKVIDNEGYIGFVPANFTGEITTETLTSDYTEPEYTHITLDQPINMVWHGIYYYESNQYVYDYTYNMTGVNVLAPTWFLFQDTEGNITSWANQDYVSYAHENGWQVWAVLEDMDGESCVDVLPYTSKRQAAIGQMINECLYYGIDGINVDLEQVTSSIGNDFIQFIRELSVACRNNGLILSVDDYTPYSYNAYRHTDEQSKVSDYVAIMAYDDYVGGNEAGPNAGLPFIQEVLDVCAGTVDMDRLIIGLPFYSRLWYEYNDGTLGRDTCSMGDVNDIVWNHGLTFEWLADVGYDYAEYEADGAKVRLWYENANSLEAKLNLLSQYNIAGISSWRLGQETNDVWAVLEQYY